MESMITSHPFYQSLLAACERVNKPSSMAMYIFNTLFPTVDSINNLENVIAASDTDLMLIPGLGEVSTDIIRMAIEIYSRSSSNLQYRLDIRGSNNTTGGDICRFIQEKGLTDKRVRFAEKNNICFETSQDRRDGMLYSMRTELNVLNGTTIRYEQPL